MKANQSSPHNTSFIVYLISCMILLTSLMTSHQVSSKLFLLGVYNAAEQILRFSPLKSWFSDIFIVPHYWGLDIIWWIWVFETWRLSRWKQDKTCIQCNARLMVEYSTALHLPDFLLMGAPITVIALCLPYCYFVIAKYAKYR